MAGKFIRLGGVVGITGDALLSGADILMPGGASEAGTFYIHTLAATGLWLVNVDHLITAGRAGAQILATNVTSAPSLVRMTLVPAIDGKTDSTPPTAVPAVTQLDFQSLGGTLLTADIYAITAGGRPGLTLRFASTGVISATTTVVVEHAPQGAVRSMFGIVDYPTNTGDWSFTFQKRIGNRVIDIMTLNSAVVGTGTGLHAAELSTDFLGDQANTPSHAIPIPDQITFTRTSGSLSAIAYLILA